MKVFALSGLWVATVVAFACGPAPVIPIEPRAFVQTGRIEGTAIVQSRSRGNIILALVNSTTGALSGSSVVLARNIFGASLNDPVSGGPFTAPFFFSNVRAGTYTLRGILDTDTCLVGAPDCRSGDYFPMYGVTSEPNSGDIASSAVDPITGVTTQFTIAQQEDGTMNIIKQAPIAFLDIGKVPTDRPVFKVTTPDLTLDPTKGTKLITVAPNPIRSGAVDQRGATLFVGFVDADRNNVPDDTTPKDGVPDLWPRVVLKKISDTNPLVLENVGLLAGVVPTPLASILFGPTGPRMGFFPVPALQIAIFPTAFDITNLAAPVPLPAVPSGRYCIQLITATGQTWTIPNEMSDNLVFDLGFPVDPTQSQFITVP